MQLTYVLYLYRLAAYMNNKNYIAYLFLALVVFIYWRRITTEGFLLNPSTSNDGEIDDGASEYYNWGYKEIPSKLANKVPFVKYNCNTCRKPCYVPVPHKKRAYPCPHCKAKFNIKNEFYVVPKTKSTDCRTCDITKNNSIDKYVLKSSVPACPDMSNFVKKSSLKPTCNHTKKNGYIKREECPKCPVCPICPKCPTDINGTSTVGGGGSGYSYEDDETFSRRDREQWSREVTGANYMLPRGGVDMERRTKHVSKGLTRKILDRPKPGDSNYGVKPYAPPFAYNNKGSNKVRAYNVFNPDWGQSLGWGFNIN